MILPEFNFENYKVIIEYKEYENIYYIYFDDMSSCMGYIDIDYNNNLDFSIFIEDKNKLLDIIKCLIQLNSFGRVYNLDLISKTFNFYDEDSSSFI